MFTEPAGDQQTGPGPQGEETERWLRLEPGPIVGREAELASLSAALAQATRAGGVCLVRGEAGVGKTRLVEEALAVLAGVQVVRSRSPERESPLPYEAAAGLLRSLRRRCGMLTLDDCSPRLAPFRPALASLLPEWRCPAPVPPDLGDKPFLFAAVAELLQELAVAQPVCLFLDDAHWTDPSSLELLEHAAEQLAGERVVVVLTARQGEPNPWLDGLLAALRRGWSFNSWTLRRLGRPASLLLAEQWLSVPHGTFDPEVADHLYQESAGNPFYLQEVISGLVEAGALVRQDGRIVRSTAGWPGVTGGMRAQIERRLERLAPAERAVLEAASVLGEPADAPILQSLLAVSPDALSESLVVLSRRCFLDTPGPPGQAGITFAHAKIREAVYQRLDADRRIAWHREAARVLRALPPTDPARSNPTIAYHLSRAEEAQEALPFLLDAADELLQAQAYADAGWHLARAAHHLEQLRLLPPDEQGARLEGRFWLLRGHLCFSQGRHEEKAAAFLRAWSCVAPLSPAADPVLKAGAALFRAQVLLSQGELEAAEAFLAEQKPFLEEALDRTEGLLHVYYALARIHGERKRWAQRRQVLRDGLTRAAEIGSEEHVSELARLLHAEALALGDDRQALGFQQLLATRAAGSGARATTLCRWQWLLAADACRRADWDGARAAAAAMLALAEQRRHEPFRTEARWLQLKIRALSEPEAALPALRAELQATSRQEERQRYGRCLALIAAGAAESGAWEEADDACEALLSHAAPLVEPERHGWIHQALLTLAESALRREQAGEALRWLGAIEEDETPAGEFWAPAETVALRAWALSAGAAPPDGGGHTAAAFPAIALEAAAATGDVRLQAIVQTQLAHAALGYGDRTMARGLVDAARPVLLDCGSIARLRSLERCLGIRASSMPVRPSPRGPAEEEPLAAGRTPPPRRPELPRLEVRLLGGFECSVEGRAIPSEAWGARKARDVFKYLLLRRGRPAPVEEILEEFWPDLTVKGARRALRSTLYRARRALEPDRPAHTPSSLVQMAEDSVRVTLGPEAVVDLYGFEDRLKQASRCEARGDPAAADRIREEAAAVYAGDLLPEDTDQSWAHSPREWLREQYLAVLTRLAEGALRRGDATAALPLAERMLESDPTCEAGLRALVRALAALGRRSEAARRFDLFARRLDRELGLAPEPETRELVETLRRERETGCS